MYKKILKGLAIALLVLFLGLIILVNTGDSLTPETDDVIEQVLRAELPEIITGETGFAKSGDLEIWYEKMKPSDPLNGTVLLVMGHSSTGIVWSNRFCQSYIDSGYQVIRYDNRDVGMSTWIDDWDEDDPYSLEDMALDGIAVLDHLGINKAHIVGASMGGMIAQRMAISHQDRVLSLTSIMSSGFMNDPQVSSVPLMTGLNFARLFLKYMIKQSEANFIRFFVGVDQAIRGSKNYGPNVKGTAQRTLYELRKRKGFNPKAVNQHAKAIETSGSRYSELAEISAPTLIIHGKGDPLVVFEHVNNYASLIPNATKLYLDEMGHDIPEMYFEEIQKAIVNNFKNID